MSIGQGLVSVTRENVIEATGAHGSFQEFFRATFQGIGAWCQTTPLEQSTHASPGRRAEASHRGSRFPHLLWEPAPRTVQEGNQAWPAERGGYLMIQGGQLVGHPAHEALRMRPVPGTLLQLRVRVALLPIISRTWIVVLYGVRGT